MLGRIDGMRILNRRFFLRLVFIAAASFLAQSCTTTTHKIDHDVTLRPEARKLLLMPMDIELSTLTAGGVLKPEAEWTANARIHVEFAIREMMASMSVACLPAAEVDESTMTDEEKEKKVQLTKLHEVVGHSILLHQYMPVLKLPGKGARFDWSLGPESRFLKDRCDADYALFVYLRDSYASAGRVATAIVFAAFGVGIPMGMQTGFASLVDLETGNVIWFNRLISGAGDLRTQEAAKSSTEALLHDFPRGN